MEYVRFLKEKGALVGIIGKSLLGREIPFIKVGASKKSVIITGAIHAREHATATLVVKQAEYALENLDKLDFSFYFIPCVNPDGMEIANGNASPPEFFKGDARLYKANARGVDLNVNFDAGWGEGKNNVFFPAGENYVGKSPFSEPETAALRDFTLSVMPSSTVSYHSKGRVIYYDFRLFAEKKRLYKPVAEALGARLRYEIVGGDEGSAGGYKDWCEEKLCMPAFTIEIGDDGLTHPLSEEDLKEDYERNIDLPFVLQKCLKTMKN